MRVPAHKVAAVYFRRLEGLSVVKSWIMFISIVCLLSVGSYSTGTALSGWQMISDDHDKIYFIVHPSYPYSIPLYSMSTSISILSLLYSLYASLFYIPFYIYLPSQCQGPPFLPLKSSFRLFLASFPRSFLHSPFSLSFVLVLLSCFSSLILCLSLLRSFAMLIYIALLALLRTGPGLVSALTLDLNDQGKWSVPDDCPALSNK